MGRPNPSCRADATARPLDAKPIERSLFRSGRTRGCAETDRSTSAEVRNPLLRLRAAEQIRALPPQARQALAALLLDLSHDARERAKQSWFRNKAPMAVYWKAVSVYAGHLYRILRPTRAELATLASGSPSSSSSTAAGSGAGSLTGRDGPSRDAS